MGGLIPAPRAVYCSQQFLLYNNLKFKFFHIFDELLDNCSPLTLDSCFKSCSICISSLAEKPQSTRQVEACFKIASDELLN